MINTVFYRTEKDGSLKRRVEQETQKQIRQDMYGNGFRVVAIYKGNISYEEHDQMDITRSLKLLDKEKN